ncbi:MAG: hypothetical protein Q7K26_03615 [bacterium]|nr:hypothetical protein [bacterium]
MENNSSKKIWTIMAVVIVAIIAGGVLYYLFLKSPDSLGIKDTKNMLTKYPQFIKKTSVQQQIQGIVQAINGNSWTLGINGQTITVTNEGKNQIHYSRFEKPATGSAQTIVPKAITAEEVQIGDMVSITRSTDWQTGKSLILSISVLPQK